MDKYKYFDMHVYTRNTYNLKYSFVINLAHENIVYTDDALLCRCYAT